MAITLGRDRKRMKEASDEGYEVAAFEAIAAAFSRLSDEDRREIGRGLMVAGKTPDGSLSLLYFIGLIVWPQMRPETLFQLRAAALRGECGELAAELPTEDPWGIVARALIELQRHADAGELTGDLPDPSDPRRS
jgi:hypothetical protein